jgi:hypothetical protein
MEMVLVYWRDSAPCCIVQVGDTPLLESRHAKACPNHGSAFPLVKAAPRSISSLPLLYNDACFQVLIMGNSICSALTLTYMAPSVLFNANQLLLWSQVKPLDTTQPTVCNEKHKQWNRLQALNSHPSSPCWEWWTFQRTEAKLTQMMMMSGNTNTPAPKQR